MLETIRGVKIAVYGDFCLDAYWILDPHGGEISVETGLQTQAVRRQYYTLGGASNVTANLAALQPESIKTIGVTGDDIFGREMLSQLNQIGVDTSRMVMQKESYDTVVFGKRYLDDAEQPRIDFGFFNKRTEETDDRIIDHLCDVMNRCDALIFNQQVPGSLSPSFIDKANQFFAEFRDKLIILDSRHFGDRFKNIIRKTNAIEAELLVDGHETEDSDIPEERLEILGINLYQQSNKPVFITRGELGMMVFDADTSHKIPGLYFTKKLDPVGAGDTVISALAASLAAGFSPVDAAVFANLAAGVTVQKRFQTGTASPDEILKLHEEAYYIHNPELARDRRRATLFQNSDIEICTDKKAFTRRIKHIIFDHDGTLSTLREGWQQVMEKTALQSIFGEALSKISTDEYESVRSHVQEFIDMTTGQQTILQMASLTEMVDEFGYVKPQDIGDALHYKEIFNKALLQHVNERTRRLERNELESVDFTIKNASTFLKALSQKEIKLYLASGTDIEDVKREATLLGYADLFNGGIYGALGDIRKFSKRLLIAQIIETNRLQGPELVVFGDGPVELQECRKYGGIAIGVASDEIRRYGLNAGKRERLIKAGAQVIIADYSQGDLLLKILFPHSNN